ncbi:hypothetical protein T10_11129 [Trichinella papuae]|uniref:Uncharacterized protein n=1 Tax=Trichinella papuae TaxID=268474 RepID=A0A0V1N706_9BILA|nr:hypothetical protein T10_11129 [Trichinella papuae]
MDHKLVSRPISCRFPVGCLMCPCKMRVNSSTCEVLVKLVVPKHDMTARYDYPLGRCSMAWPAGGTMKTHQCPVDMWRI